MLCLDDDARWRVLWLVERGGHSLLSAFGWATSPSLELCHGHPPSP